MKAEIQYRRYRYTTGPSEPWKKVECIDPYFEMYLRSIPIGEISIHGSLEGINEYRLHTPYKMISVSTADDGQYRFGCHCGFSYMTYDYYRLVGEMKVHSHG